MNISNNVRSNANLTIDAATNKTTSETSGTGSKLLDSVSVVMNTPASLIGKTVNPHFANATLDKISYDGHGKILEFRKKMSSKEIDTVAANVITPLSQTPARAETAIRTPQECLVKLATILQKSNLPATAKETVLLMARNTFLAGNIEHSTIETFYKDIRPLVAGNPGLMKELNKAVATLEQEFYITKRNDNYYGRTFDTELAKHIVNSPSAQTINNTEIIKNTLLKALNQLTSGYKSQICQDIHRGLKDDPATWRSDIREVKRFMAQNSFDNLVKMITSPSKLKHLLMMQLSMKFLLNTPGYQDLRTSSDRRYNDVIIPQRKFEDTLNPDLIKSSRTGIQLHYQVREQLAKEATGERPIDRYRPLDEDQTEHNLLAMNAEQAIGVGMSGSANVLGHFFDVLHEENENFDIDHARLFAAAYLTHSGGHSFNEAYTVFNYDEKQSFEPMTFDSLANQNAYASNAVNTAYDKLLAIALEL